MPLVNSGALIVNSSQLAANVVTATAIAADAVTTAKILNANVTAAKLATNAVIQAGITDTTSELSTTSTTWIDLTGASITMTTGANRVLLLAAFTSSNDTVTGGCQYTFLMDATRYGGSNGLLRFHEDTANLVKPVTMVFLTPALSAGSHTFKVQWQVNNTGKTNTSAVNDIVFIAIEMKE